MESWANEISSLETVFEDGSMHGREDSLQTALKPSSMLKYLLRFLPRTLRTLLVVGSMVACFHFAVTSTKAEEPAVNFGLDIRPILSDHCFACHGPDEKDRAADLRLDTAEGIETVVDVDNVEDSELITRMRSDDEEMVMPPPDFHKPLSPDQKKLLKDWIASGAVYTQHWAFQTPKVDDAIVSQEEVGSLSPQQSANAIDHFIDSELENVGLEANGVADPRSLLRRVTLDLIGLPPTHAQINEFVHDGSPDAYEKLVDRLLATDEYGQHVGRYWLDLVRYADTHGLHLDNYREMWLYRDWVIESFNTNMPFDKFIQKQLAGDLIPNATVSDRIASGFNRLNVTTNEGGSIYDEVFARNCMDRTDAFGTIFLGLTTGCAVCHDHKFDPIPQRDYYSLSAFFNSLDGSALDGNEQYPAPSIPVPSADQEELMTQIDATIKDLQTEMDGPLPSVDQSQVAWEASLSGNAKPRRYRLIPTEVTSDAKVEMRVEEDQTISLVGEAADKDTTTVVADLPPKTLWKTLHLEAIADGKRDRVGAAENGNVVLSELRVEMTDDELGGKWINIPITAAFADVEQNSGDYAVSNSIDTKVDADKGWGVKGHQQTGPRNAWFVVPSLVAAGPNPKIRVHLDYQSKYAKHQFQQIRLTLSDAALTLPPDQQVTLGPIHTTGPFPVESAGAAYYRSFASQKGEFKPSEVFVYESREYRWHHRGDLPQIESHSVSAIKDRASVVVWHQSLESPEPQKVTLLLGVDDGYHVYLNGKQVGEVRGPKPFHPLGKEWPLKLKKGHNDLYIKLINHAKESDLTYAFRSVALAAPADLKQLASLPQKERTDATSKSLQKYYRSVYCTHPEWASLQSLKRGAEKSKEKLEAEIPKTLVWKETKEPRPAHILNRGQYDQPGEEVTRETPSFLPPFPIHAPRDRLGLAQWLTQADHPLTARVAVNRFWQQFFGTGLVKTSEDFGSQGEPPSHLDLIDFLAVDFQSHDWDVKRLIKTIVMTDAYRRSAKTSDAIQSIDPTNRLLARGPRFRLDAETLRDQALALSGQLVIDRGGPSVKPPQPGGLWKAVGYSGSNTVEFTADEGDKVYRRSVYMFWKRTSPPPQMTTLDAPSRESCTARRERTNTPLQALLLLNETQYLEASRHLIKRMMHEIDSKDDRDRLRWVFEGVTAREPTDAEFSELNQLLNDLTTYYENNPTLAAKFVDSSDAKLAAWTVIGSTLLNLDEVVNK